MTILLNNVLLSRTIHDIRSYGRGVRQIAERDGRGSKRRTAV